MPPGDLQFHCMILYWGPEAESQRPSTGGGICLKAMELRPNGSAGAPVPIPGRGMMLGRWPEELPWAVLFHGKILHRGG